MQWRRRKRRTNSDPSANERKILHKPKRRYNYSISPPLSANEAPKPSLCHSEEDSLPARAYPEDSPISAFLTAMSALPSISDGIQSPFFQLPREIRDCVWMHYCYPGTRQKGPLAGYLDVPSPAPLAVSKQMHAELSPIYYESLKHTLVQDRVCLKLPSKNVPGYSRYAGWNLWYLNWESSSCCFNVWVRDGSDAGEYAAWWVDARNLCSLSEFAKFNTPLGGVFASQAFAQLVTALERLQATPSMLPNPPKLMMRLRRVVGKVQRNLKDIKEREAKASAQSAPSDTCLNSLPPLGAPAPWDGS